MVMLKFYADIRNVMKKDQPQELDVFILSWFSGDRNSRVANWFGSKQNI